VDPLNLASSDDSLNVLQISDTHLFADSEDSLLGLNTEQSLKECLALAQDKHWPPDLILLSGDLAHGASGKAYRRLHQLLSTLDIPVCPIPGNHDNPEVMERILTGGSFVSEKSILTDHWQIILLDSSTPGSEAGFLSETDLSYLEKCLQEHPEHNALICLHHPPMEIGCQWIDPIKLENSEVFLTLLKEYPNVRLIVYGHIHQEHESTSNGIKMLSAPSTCIQFKPGAADFALDNKASGYRWLKLHANGKFETGVSRLDTLPTELDLASSGY
jgi:Icc protein